MPPERRYDEDEVREIFRRAASRSVATTDDPQPTGMTLAELQDVGREVGLDPGAVAQAASSLAHRSTGLPRRTYLGMPIAVGHVVPLPRPPTDAEWERLVSELRSTFGARGRITVHGGLREWSNGNLHACIEPDDQGYRLRLGTRKGDAQVLNSMGFAGIAAGTLSFAAMALGGTLPEAVLIPWMISSAGVGAFLANVLRLHPWAARRERQMQELARKIRQIMGAELPPGEPED